MILRQAVAGRLPVFVAGLYCVLVCVVPVGLAPLAPPVARVACWVSLACLPLGLLAPSPWLALLAGLGGVLGGATVAFAAALWAGQAVTPTPLGVLGFFAFALAWGALSSPAARQGVAQGVTLDWLSPRRRVSALQVRLASLFLLCLPLLLLVPLGLAPAGQATFALVLSLGLILLLAPSTSDLMARLWLPEFAAPIARRRIVRWVASALLVAVACGWVWLLRRS